MDYQYILVDVKDRIATVTINRPEYSNAFARESYYEIADAMNNLRCKRRCRRYRYHRRRKTFLCRWRYQTF